MLRTGDDDAHRMSDPSSKKVLPASARNRPGRRWCRAPRHVPQMAFTIVVVCTCWPSGVGIMPKNTDARSPSQAAPSRQSACGKGHSQVQPRNHVRRKRRAHRRLIHPLIADRKSFILLSLMRLSMQDRPLVPAPVGIRPDRECAGGHIHQKEPLSSRQAPNSVAPA